MNTLHITSVTSGAQCVRFEWRRDVAHVLAARGTTAHPLEVGQSVCKTSRVAQAPSRRAMLAATTSQQQHSQSTEGYF